MGVQWTEEQKKVIELRNRNILVSAAAGSGKTAVLVERIIRILTDADHPVDVDRLLIVTFTEAAAAEMKERIRGAIEKELENRPEDVHLQRQATLIHSAQITTIHSFCLSVIREHFHVIDIDPGFRIAEEGELKLLKQDVLEDLLEECYEERTEGFLEFVEKLGSGRNDRKLEELILQLYEYSRSYPQPEKWLRQCAQMYAPCAQGQPEGAGGQNLPNTPEAADAQDAPGRSEAADARDAAEAVSNGVQEPVYFRKAMAQVKQYLADVRELLTQGIRICEEPDGPYMYGDMLESDREMLEGILAADTFAGLYERILSANWKRLSAKKDESVSPEKRDQVKALRDQMKKLVKDLAATYFYERPEELLEDMESSYGVMKVFTELVIRFGEAFAEQKQRKNMIDFSDMEQFALRILTEEQEGELIPSLAAREYQEQFAEVMIDEYQDSNLIQEAILTSVSTVGRGKNNIFMVGDVKQSIYRFRLSRPELFMEKYDTYDTGDSDRQRIDLHRNFRSRAEVLDSVNDVFRRIMRKELGGIVYDGQAALYPGADFEPLLREDGTSVNETELLLLDTSESELPEEEDGAEYAKGTDRQLEARMVAKRIHELVRNGQVKDKKTGEYRKARYQDMVILTRSIRGWADVFSAVLMEEGIPAYAGSREGYFEAYEVSVLLDYLRLLDNQRQDVPLAAVLASPFAGLDAGQMAELRAAAPEGTFYEAAEQYVNAGRMQDPGEENQGQELWRRLDAFYRQLEHFRDMVPFTAIHELLWKIMEDTGYGLYIAAMPGGEQRSANLEMLVEKAAAFEGSSYKGLFNFVRYIEQLQKYNVDYGEANIADEQSDTVRIMSIHKSKGLEFPIVFVAGMGKRFNTQDVRGSMIIHPEWGVGIDAVDL
ncbi:MAG: UvrD-helicase domain-containing protein, partial [Ruminococcus sp.]|nr:UvrD-helicase domain-containing protein [Ruminococcus sp.]